MGVWVCEPRSNEAARCMLCARVCAFVAACTMVHHAVCQCRGCLLGRLVGGSVACLQPLFPAFPCSLAPSAPLPPPPLKGHYRLETLASASILPPSLPLWFACIAANKVFNMARGGVGVVGGIGIG